MSDASPDFPSPSPTQAERLAAETAKSYLEDVRHQSKSIGNIDNYITRHSAVKEIIEGDLRLARQEAQQAPEEDRRQLLASCDFCEGVILFRQASAYQQELEFTELRKERDDIAIRAANCFTSAAQQAPQPVYYYNLGRVYSCLGKKWEATQAFEQAMNGDDPEIALDARKEIGRIGPVSAPTSASTSQNQTGGCTSVLAVVGVLIALLVVGNLVAQGKQGRGANVPAATSRNIPQKAAPSRVAGGVKAAATALGQAKPIKHTDNDDNNDAEQSDAPSPFLSSSSATPAQERRLTTSDVRGKSKIALDLMRNELYARHGYQFSKRRPDLTRHFSRQLWYQPDTQNQDVAFARFTALEKRNAAFIREYQIAQGMLKK